ncbi:MAG: tRNA (adenosine(37)-N6)-threonylcarbamoyltransferase complex ATPase subunit type 1 TsaE [Candidatus Gastranaerophilales bacterium]|nr:tRNA (adenosine(37)-N6)-threonylcarbamoyltransferase complex ATPase subunit type 1 TsaE [Candidatus Gastranaerophilales bacterium]
MKIKTETLKDTKKLAKIFAECLDENGLFVTLTGDIGAGKTQFVRYVLEYLNVSEKVTSPSFVILNEYKSSLCPIYHFDLYRLEQKGLSSMIDELREYSKIGKLTFIEWAEFGLNEVPDVALNINVEYDEENLDIRYFTFSSQNKGNDIFLDKLAKRVNK